MSNSSVPPPDECLPALHLKTFFYCGPLAVVCWLQAVDMWSLGVLFYTLLGGYHPFHDERQPRLFRRIRDGSYMFHEELWDSTSDQAKVCLFVLLWRS